MRDRLRSCGLIDQGFFQVLLLLGIKVVVILGDIGHGFGKELLTACAHLLFTESSFKALPAALE